MKKTSVCAVLTCFNRRQKTLSCLEALFSNVPADISVTAVLVDDGSTDGTGDAVAQRFPGVTVIRGDGSLFWAGGMRRAIATVLELPPDYVLWLNDDTLLLADGLPRMLGAASGIEGASIIVGATKDPDSGLTSYGGRVRPYPLRPIYCELVEPQDRPVPVETMNGNCVLVSREALRKVGNISPEYVHGLADWDYAFRAAKQGIPVMLAAGHVGHCVNDAVERDRRATVRGVRAHWRKVTGPKAYPFKAWFTFARRHCGPIWPVFWAMPYLRALTAGLTGR